MSEHRGHSSHNEWHVIVAKDIEQVELMRQTWQHMESRELYLVTNANIDRYLSVLQPQKDKMHPYVMLFKSGNEPIAMVIARLEKLELKCKVGYKVVVSPSVRALTVVYGGILGQPKPETYTIIVCKLMEVLECGDADVVFFNQLRIDSPMYDIALHTPGFLCRTHFPELQLHWQTFISGSTTEGHKWVSKKHQRDIARCRRNLEKACSGVVKVVSYREEKDVDYVMDVISDISALTYKRGLGVEFIKSPLTRSLFEQAARDGWLRVYILYAGSEPIAFEVGYVYGRVYFAEQAAFDPQWRSYSPGTILQLAIFEELRANEAVDAYDYGFGDATYKQRFGDMYWPERAVYIFAPRFYPVIVNCINSSIRGLSLGLAYLVGKLGFTAKLKRRWRDLLQRKR